MAWSTVGQVFVTAGCSWELVFGEVADRIAFEEKSLSVLLARYQENPVKPNLGGG